MTTITNAHDLADLKRAYALLESESVTAKLTGLVGKPVDWAIAQLPESATAKIHDAVNTALKKSASVALSTMADAPHEEAWTALHKVAAAASGAAGGFFGMAGLLVELPVTTTIMMRSIADIARSEGFSLADPNVQEDCIAVFALGSPSPGDDASETGYYASRAMLNKVLEQMGAELARNAAGRATARGISTTQAGAWLAKLIEAVAARFGVIITEKVALQSVPVLGAVTGATINALFTDYFQDLARGHFIVRRLEERYGADAVQAAYAALKRPSPAYG